MESGGALRQVCAEVRHAFLEAAAELLGTGIDDLDVRDGTIHRKTSNQTATYWELAAAVDLARDARGDIAPKRPEQLKLVGRPVARIDLPAKVTGAGIYVHDLDLPGLLHGRVLRPPSYTARLSAFDATRVEAMPGVVKVVRLGRFVGVVTLREEQAVAAHAALGRAVRWTETPDLPDVDALPAYLRALPSTQMVLSEKGTPPAAGVGAIQASYSRPFMAHR